MSVSVEKIALWMLQKFDVEFGELLTYADAKMVGISFGINNKPKTETAYTSFKTNHTAQKTAVRLTAMNG